MKIRKSVKKELQQTIDPIQQINLKDRVRITWEHIADKNTQSRSNKINKIAKNIKTNLDNGDKRWEVRRKITKREIQYQIRNGINKIIQDPLEIIKEYEKYYKFMKGWKAHSIEEEKIEIQVEKFNKILKEPETDEGETITKNGRNRIKRDK